VAEANEPDVGGDPACWAHLVDEPAEPESDVVDLAALARAAIPPGPAWTHRSDDLNVNLVVFPAGEGVAEHVNAEVDVLLVGIAGAGLVAIDGLPRVLRAGQAIVIAKGARRWTQAVSDPFAYLTCHRRRGGLWPRP
jgi:quercetin dioxygenase-like cupin family protein